MHGVEEAAGPPFQIARKAAGPLLVASYGDRPEQDRDRLETALLVKHPACPGEVLLFQLPAAIFALVPTVYLVGVLAQQANVLLLIAFAHVDTVAEWHCVEDS